MDLFRHLADGLLWTLVTLLPAWTVWRFFARIASDAPVLDRSAVDETHRQQPNARASGRSGRGATPEAPRKRTAKRR